MTLIHGLSVGRSSKASSAEDPGTEMQQQPTHPTPQLLYNKLTSSGNFMFYGKKWEDSINIIIFFIWHLL